MLNIQLTHFSKPVEITQTDIPTASKGRVVVKLEATPILSYSRQYLEGKLPYSYPEMPFTPGTNAVGIVHAVGDDVLSLKVGQRVIVDCNWIKDEGVENPERILIGLTGISPNSAGMLNEFPHGTWREYGEFPASVVMPIDGSEDIDALTMIACAKLIVPFGGLRRLQLKAGETVIINGASGYFGSGAVMAAVAMGANVILTGRNAAKLQAIANKIEPTGRQVRVIAQTENMQEDIASLRNAFGGDGAHKALCMIGGSTSAYSTKVSLNALKPYGQLVLMGSMLAPLDIDYNLVLLNNWEIKGNFMYSRADYYALINMIKAGLIDLTRIESKVFNMNDIEQAIDSAGQMQGLSNVVLNLKNN